MKCPLAVVKLYFKTNAVQDYHRFFKERFVIQIFTLNVPAHKNLKVPRYLFLLIN